MKIVRKIITTKEEEEVVDVLCNKCGKTCRNPGAYEQSPYGLIEQTYSGGYGSTPLDDCTNYTFSICESCLKDFFDSFIIPVEISEY